MLPTYQPPFVPDRVVGSLMGAAGLCLGVLSVALLNVYVGMLRPMSNLGRPESQFGVPPGPPPDLTTPMLLIGVLVAIYLACAIGIFMSRPWGFWLTIGFMVLAGLTSSGGGLMLGVLTIVYSGLRLSGTVGPKPT